MVPEVQSGRKRETRSVPSPASTMRTVPIQVPSTIQDIDALIRDRVQENIHLDYKASAAIADNKGHEISKDASAFANSDGGILIYGVEEKNNIPIRIDDGVDDRKFSREWLEQIIISRVTPIIDGLRIIPISLGSGTTLYVVSVPKSQRGPHQASDKKYYKRGNFISQPMEDYEIKDVRNRWVSVPPLLTFEIFDWRRIAAAFDVSNVGGAVAENVSFEFVPPIPWPKNRPIPQLFEKGVNKFAPKQRLRFLYFSYLEILNGSAGVPLEFEVRIKYFHPHTETIITDVWPVSFSAHDNSIVMRSEMEDHAQDLVKGIKELTEQAKMLHSTLESFKPIIGSTGLDISVPALRNLGRVLRDGNDPERIHPVGADGDVFREVLGVDARMAHSICECLSYNYNPEGLKHLPDMTPELMKRIRAAFIIEDLPKPPAPYGGTE
jgi:Putative DNA-binding domain